MKSEVKGTATSKRLGNTAIDVSSDAGSVVIRVVKRALVTGPATADQPRQRRRRSKTRLMR